MRRGSGICFLRIKEKWPYVTVRHLLENTFFQRGLQSMKCSIYYEGKGELRKIGLEEGYIWSANEPSYLFIKGTYEKHC
jgi:hypothetical protein